MFDCVSQAKKSKSKIAQAKAKLVDKIPGREDARKETPLEKRARARALAQDRKDAHKQKQKANQKKTIKGTIAKDLDNVVNQVKDVAELKGEKGKAKDEKPKKAVVDHGYTLTKGDQVSTRTSPWVVKFNTTGDNPY